MQFGGKKIYSKTCQKSLTQTVRLCNNYCGPNENEAIPVQCFQLITNLYNCLCVSFWYEKLFDPIQKSAVTSENINRFKYSVSPWMDMEFKWFGFFFVIQYCLGGILVYVQLLYLLRVISFYEIYLCARKVFHGIVKWMFMVVVTHRKGIFQLLSFHSIHSHRHLHHTEHFRKKKQLTMSHWATHTCF